MASFNKVILIGNITADPELKQTLAGISVCSFSIAVNRRFAKTEGQQTVDFINVVSWRNTAEFVSRYFKKGNPILVCGQLQTRSYNDRDDQLRYVTEVLAEEVSFVVAREQSNASSPPQNNNGGGNIPAAYASAGANTRFEEIPNDSDLPF